MSATYYDTSYPPKLYRASGATAGIPGTWTPSGLTPPASVTDLASGYPVTVTASPATAWTSGQYVQTQTAGPAGRASWSGTNWVGGAAPLAQSESQSESTPTFPAVPVDEKPKDIGTPPPETEP